MQDQPVGYGVLARREAWRRRVTPYAYGSTASIYPCVPGIFQLERLRSDKIHRFTLQSRP